MNSSTFSSKHWLCLFLSIVVTVVLVFAVASEWMIRTYVTPLDTYEYIAARLLSSDQPNAAFGDSHVAAVPDYNKKDFINLGIGATTIRKMDDRVRFYYRKLQPGEVIIQADPHSFAEYRMEAQGDYVPEVYSPWRLRILDPKHRGFMTEYWIKFFSPGGLRGQPQPGYDDLWRHVGSMVLNGKAESASGETPTTPGSGAGVTDTAPAGTSDADREALAKFNTFMNYEISTHTPAANFRERDEARIYKDLIAYLVARGAKVCMVNYPVDVFYRERADRIPGFAETRKFYQEVARANGIPYVSFWDRFKDESMFQNTDHVNQLGSPILAREAREACFGKGAHG